MLKQANERYAGGWIFFASRGCVRDMKSYPSKLLGNSQSLQKDAVVAEDLGVEAA